VIQDQGEYRELQVHRVQLVLKELLEMMVLRGLLVCRVFRDQQDHAVLRVTRVRLDQEATQDHKVHKVRMDQKVLQDQRVPQELEFRDPQVRLEGLDQLVLLEKLELEKLVLEDLMVQQDRQDLGGQLEQLVHKVFRVIRVLLEYKVLQDQLGLQVQPAQFLDLLDLKVLQEPRDRKVFRDQQDLQEMA
jgi:hypothetical protein